MARIALEFGPADLARVVELHKEAFDEGLLAGQREETSNKAGDHMATRDGELQNRIIREASTIIDGIRSREPMELIVYRLGLVSHLVSDANNPFLTYESSRLGTRRADFEAYVLRRSHRYRPVFYGIERPYDPRGTVARAVRRSSQYGPLLDREYFRGDQVRSSSSFDDRSTAFAVGSLSYSHSISDLINLYYTIWSRVGGDVRGASRLKPGQLSIQED